MATAQPQDANQLSEEMQLIWEKLDHMESLMTRVRKSIPRSEKDDSLYSKNCLKKRVSAEEKEIQDNELSLIELGGELRETFNAKLQVLKAEDEKTEWTLRGKFLKQRARNEMQTRSIKKRESGNEAGDKEEEVVKLEYQWPDESTLPNEKEMTAHTLTEYKKAKEDLVLTPEEKKEVQYFSNAWKMRRKGLLALDDEDTSARLREFRRLQNRINARCDEKTHCFTPFGTGLVSIVEGGGRDHLDRPHSCMDLFIVRSAKATFGSGEKFELLPVCRGCLNINTPETPIVFTLKQIRDIIPAMFASFRALYFVSDLVGLNQNGGQVQNWIHTTRRVLQQVLGNKMFVGEKRQPLHDALHEYCNDFSIGNDMKDVRKIVDSSFAALGREIRKRKVSNIGVRVFFTNAEAEEEGAINQVKYHFSCDTCQPLLGECMPEMLNTNFEVSAVRRRELSRMEIASSPLVMVKAKNIKSLRTGYFGGSSGSIALDSNPIIGAPIPNAAIASSGIKQSAEAHLKIANALPKIQNELLMAREKSRQEQENKRIAIKKQHASEEMARILGRDLDDTQRKYEDTKHELMQTQMKFQQCRVALEEYPKLTQELAAKQKQLDDLYSRLTRIGELAIINHKIRQRGFFFGLFKKKRNPHEEYPYQQGKEYENTELNKIILGESKNENDESESYNGDEDDSDKGDDNGNDDDDDKPKGDAIVADDSSKDTDDDITDTDYDDNSSENEENEKNEKNDADGEKENKKEKKREMITSRPRMGMVGSMMSIFQKPDEATKEEDSKDQSKSEPIKEDALVTDTESKDQSKSEPIKEDTLDHVPEPEEKDISSNTSEKAEPEHSYPIPDAEIDPTKDNEDNQETDIENVGENDKDSMNEKASSKEKKQNQKGKRKWGGFFKRKKKQQATEQQEETDKEEMEEETKEQMSENLMNFLSDVSSDDEGFTDTSELEETFGVKLKKVPKTNEGTYDLNDAAENDDEEPEVTGEDASELVEKPKKVDESNLLKQRRRKRYTKRNGSRKLEPITPTSDDDEEDTIVSENKNEYPQAKKKQSQSKKPEIIENALLSPKKSKRRLFGRLKINNFIPRSDEIDPLDNTFGVDFTIRNLDKEMHSNPTKRACFDEQYNMKEYL